MMIIIMALLIIRATIATMALVEKIKLIKIKLLKK